jgi:hypothetical protein
LLSKIKVAERLDNRFNVLAQLRSFACTKEEWATRMYPHGVTPYAPIFMTADANDFKFRNSPVDFFTEKEYYMPKRQTDLYLSTFWSYESMMVGMTAVHDQWNNMAPKSTSLHLVFSRDGFHYDRIPAAPHQPSSGGGGRKGFLNMGSRPSNSRRSPNELPIAGMLVVGDVLHLYSSAFTMTDDWKDDFVRRTNRTYGYTKTIFEAQIWEIRRDGFASLHVDENSKDKVGVVVTEKMIFGDVGNNMGGENEYLFVNAAASENSRVRVKLECACKNNQHAFACDDDGWSNWVQKDTTKERVHWESKTSLQKYYGIPVILTFEIEYHASLFSFWFGPETGESEGWIGNTMKV